MNASIETLTATQAIEASIREDRIAWIEGDDQAHSDLLAECDDNVVAKGGTSRYDRVTEYWGETEDGDTWRVHVVGA